jgi:autotransporter-associated beta strand protein
MKTLDSRLLATAIATLIFLTSHRPAHADSAAWSATPTSGDWNDASNWMPNTVPNSATDVATFAGSNVTALSISDTDIDLDSAVFNNGAPPYTLTAEGRDLTFYGAGIVNNSGVMQSFVVTSPPLSFFPDLSFHDNASAGELTTFSTTNGNFGFSDSASAGSATFNVTCGENGDGDCPGGSSISFASNTTAANATINVNYAAARFNGGSGGNATFNISGGSYLSLYNAYLDRATINLIGGVNAPYGESNAYIIGTTDAADAAFTTIGGSMSGDKGGLVEFSDTTTAGNATFVINGGMGMGLSGTNLIFYADSTAANATITANGGLDGSAGGVILFGMSSDGGTASITLNGNAKLNITTHKVPGVTIGSLAGAGSVLLGVNMLTVGSNNLSTTFFGAIEDGSAGSGGSLSKIGTGTLTLSGAGTYSGATYVTAGALLVSNTRGSATGSGNVAVNGGTLGGGGIIAGAVTVGTGSNSGAILQPRFGTNEKVTLTIRGLLTFNADATYSFALRNKKAEVVADGVTILDGAQFTMTAPNRSLPAHKTATVINNTSATPISGTFANLPDGGTITVGNNTFQANYEGGDGNDLTLTVVP